MGKQIYIITQALTVCTAIGIGMLIAGDGWYKWAALAFTPVFAFLVCKPNRSLSEYLDNEFRKTLTKNMRKDMAKKIK